MKRYRYPGQLGRASSDEAVLQLYRAARADGLAPDDAVEQAELDRRLDVLILLMKHFGISPEAETQWFTLAWRLADAHVPAFKLGGKGPGRPPSIKTIGDLYRRYGLARHASGRTGSHSRAPRKDAHEFVRNIPDVARRLPSVRASASFAAWRTEVGARNSDAAAVEYMLLRLHQEKGKNKARAHAAAKRERKSVLNALSRHRRSLLDRPAK